MMWVVGCFLVAQVQAATVYVDVDSTNPVSPYTSWATAATGIQEAVDVAVNGDTVLVEDGHYLLSSEILVSKEITLQSVNGADATIMDGQGGCRGFNLGSSACVVRGFTVTNGYSKYSYGGGIYCNRSAVPVIENCTLTDNYSGYGGGGIYYGTASNCVIRSNSVKSNGGGGIYYTLATDCLISRNSGVSGGGVIGGVLNNCVVSENVASGGGGGVYNATTVNNCVISGNSAGLGGGGIERGTVNNCTISGNTAAGQGGGMLYGTVNNCILFNNQPTETYGTTAHYSCAAGLTHGSNGNITNNPALVSSSHIATDSPCVGAGTNLYVSGTDIDGEAWQDPPSMGCDEKMVGESPSGEIALSLVGPLKVVKDYSANYSVLVLGNVSEFSIDFGNGDTFTNTFTAETAWSTTGNYDVVMSAYNDDHPSGVIVTQVVSVMNAEDIVIHVAKTGNDSNDGSSWAQAKLTIQAGIDAQEYEGGIVRVDDGHYIPADTITINKPISLESVNGAEEAVIDGNGSHSCFLLAGHCVVSGLTITNGYGGSPLYYGGSGVCCANDDPVVEDCILINNRTYSSYNGGGMCRGTAVRCLITGNTAGKSGGGMMNGTANNCVIIGNEAVRYGGGVDSCTVNNCVISGNRSIEGGGGMMNGTANNCTFTGNTTGDVGGGIWSGTANNCILFDNFPENAYSVDGYNNCAPELTHGTDGNITNNPVLVSSSHIAVNSPCRAAGNPAYASGTDIDGDAWQNPPSMGCDEKYVGETPSGDIILSLNGPVAVINEYPIQYGIQVIGNVSGFSVDFGNGTIVSNQLWVSATWLVTGNYDVVLSAFNDDHPAGVTLTQVVTVVDAADVIVHVSKTGSDSNDGSSWADAKATIQTGIDEQGYQGGTVLVGDGTYVPTATISISKDVVLQSLNGASSTIIDGDGVRSCLALNANACVVSGFTITNGYNSGYGGGVTCDYDKTPIVENCTIVGNRSGYAGGGISEGIANHCILSDNTAAQNGGGSYSSTLSNCLLTGNRVGYNGGGAYGGSLANCLVSGNSATNWAGGVYGGILSNCTVVGNSSGAHFGGVYQSEVYNSIIWSNTTLGNNPNGSVAALHYSCTPIAVPWGGTGNIDSDPLFVSGTDFRLQEGSPCINAGNNLYAPEGTDLIGNPRISAGTVDMGAYETAPPPSFTITTSAGANGAITPENPSVFQGDDQVFTIQPNTGYHIETLAVDGAPVPLDTSYTFTNVQTTHTIHATFAANLGTIYVDDSRSDDSGDGTSWATAKKTIQAAVDLAFAGDLILVEDGTYGSGGATTPGYALANRVCITEAITLQSVNGPAATIIQGAAGSNGGNDADSVRGVFMTNNCSLIGFTITDGYTRNTGDDYFDQSGGGIWLTDGCVVSNCVLSANFAARYEYAPGFGGGAFLYYGGTLEDCLFDGNAANYGGGAATWYGEGILRNCTLSNNSANYEGGGVRLLRGGTTLTNCTLNGNVASKGGGAYLSDSGTLDLCTLSGNSAQSGGGVYLSSGGTLNDCTLNENIALETGGGTYLSNGGTLNRCLIMDNFSKQGQGGGVLCGAGSTLNSCRITGNSALPSSDGGGVYCSSGAMLNNCIVDENSAYGGGGVRLQNGSVMNNCVVKGNTATRYGGGVKAYSGDVYVNNSIVWDNRAGVGGNNFSGSSVTIHKRNTCASSDITPGVDGCITNYPGFVNETIGDLNLLANSPCIDAGNNSYMPAGPDYAGNPRLVNGTVDIGAYETPALPGFSITTSAGANGSITPENPSVFQGYDQLFSIQPIPGYRVETLEVDGSVVSPATSYTFTNVQATHTISATFGVNASTLYVDASRPDDSGDGASWATAKKTIQPAVDEVADGGTVIVTNGVYATGYTVTPGHTARNRVCITRAITVQSVNGPEVTVIEGQAGANGDYDVNSVRGVYMQNGCSLSGFTIRNGFTQNNYNDDYDNWGGGIFVLDHCTISNCVLSGNSARNKGGGAYLRSGGLLVDCVLRDNFSDDGGGGAYIYNGGILNHCTLMNNEAGDGGGAAADSEESGTLNNCLLNGNTARGGGGLYEGTANGCVFTGNSATDGGGMQYGKANNCTFTLNTAADVGGGFAWGTARNCILWYNTAGEGGNNLDDMDSPTLYSCSPDLVHGSNGNITNAPVMVSASHISTSSPCIGAGSTSYASGTDIDGEAWQSPPSMGCDEILGSVTGPIQLSVSGPESVCENHATTYWIDIQGAVTQTVLDFDDGTLVTNAMLSVDHAWSTPGSKTITLIGYNDEFSGGVSTSLTVQVYSELASAIHVSPAGNNANDGTSWAAAKKTIQAGVDAQEIAGGIVWVTNGTYSLSSSIKVHKEVRIISVNGTASTVVDGRGAVQCFNLEDSKCLISGFTITNGWANGSTPDGGWETSGGGVKCAGLNPVVSNCVFAGNRARSGGGMYEGTVKGSIFSGNQAMDSSYGQGGGQYQGASENCLFVENTATYYGGGVAYSSLRNCTVVNNTVTGGRAGGVGGSSAYNCVVWGNTATSSGNNIYGGEAINTCSPDGVTHGVNGCITSDPLFVDGAGGNFQLLETSPCVNAGNNLYAPDGTDLAGSPRINAGTVDMGAYEYFVQSSFIIASTAGANGTISPIDPEVIRGDDQSFTIQPAYGYRIDALTVDGSIVASTTNYTFSNVQSTHTINASFTIDAYYVDASQADDSGDGRSWATAKQTIQAAVDLAADGGTVLVTNGIYAVGETLTPGFALNNRVCITKPITVQSVNGPEVTLIQGAAGSNGGWDVDAVRGVYMDNGCSLNGFTVTNGYAMATGDAYMDRAGGGLHISAGCVVSNCLLTGNSATYGGGVYFAEGGTINNSVVRENSGRFGGGAYFRSGGTLNNGLLTENSAEADGNGVYCWQGGTLNGSTLSLNYRNSGGTGYGAYLYYGGILNNCILWGNDVGVDRDLIRIASGAVLRNTCAGNGILPGDEGCITNDPLFVDAASGNFQLEASSPCINSGTNLYATGTDLAGNPRIIDGTVDMGAYENQVVRFLITTTTGANGLISPASPWVYQGTNQTFAIQPELGYYIQSLEADGSPVAIATNYTFTNVQAPHSLAATFATDPHTLTVENGTGDGAYIIGTEVPLVADAPAVGYAFYEWTVDPEAYAGHLTNRYTASTLFTMSESNVTVTANYGLLETYADASRPDDSGDGMSWATAKKTIQAAIDAVGHNGTVWVADGEYSTGGAVTPDYSLMNRVCITRGIAVRSMNGADSTVIRGATAVRGVFMASGTILSGFTIWRGETLDFTGSENAYFDRSGGGVFLQSNCEVSNCKLTGNDADHYGGGAYLHSGGSLNNCMVINNHATYGGGAYPNNGGTLNNCTVTDNRASFGGGIYMNYGVLNNTVVWGNRAGVDPGMDMYLAGVNTIRNTCSSEGITDGVNGCVKSDPLFVDPVGNFHLQAASPCIDGGDNAYRTTAVDFDGIPIPLDGDANGTPVVDIGCYEFVSPAADSDGDHMNDRGEIIAGTDPLDPESYFQVTTDTNDGLPPRIIINWEAVTGRVYNVLWTPSLSEPFQPLETGIQYPQSSYTDTVHTVESFGFYRVVVMLADYDSNGNGLPNDWEDEYGQSDPYADVDFDGFDNLSEFISGTDPTNGALFFTVGQTFADVGGTNCFVVEWISIPDRLYSVQWSTDLASGFQTLETEIEFPQNSYTDTTHNVESASFYKVDVQLK